MHGRLKLNRLRAVVAILAIRVVLTTCSASKVLRLRVIKADKNMYSWEFLRILHPRNNEIKRNADYKG